MIHYFNNEYGGQTPEIFKANLLKYLLVAELIQDLDEFYRIIKEVKIKKSGFTLIIRNEKHKFKWQPGGITFTENCPHNCYILTERQQKWILSS